MPSLFQSVRAKRPTVRWVSIVAGGLLIQTLLAGCVGDAAETGVTDTPPTNSSDSAEPPSDTMAKVEPATPARPTVPPPPDLMGKQQAEIIEILGRPAFARRDKPALLMRYREDGCILDLFLYPARSASGDTAAPDRAVEHIEARSDAGQNMAPKSCIAAVIKARGGEQPS